MIKRGLDEFHIEDGEPEKVDHLLFIVHGIGSVCDLKFRTVEEVGTIRIIFINLQYSFKCKLIVSLKILLSQRGNSERHDK